MDKNNQSENELRKSAWTSEEHEYEKQHINALPSIECLDIQALNYSTAVDQTKRNLDEMILLKMLVDSEFFC